jgi:hypothetical protein
MRCKFGTRTMDGDYGRNFSADRGTGPPVPLDFARGHRFIPILCAALCLLVGAETFGK